MSLASEFKVTHEDLKRDPELRNAYKKAAMDHVLDDMMDFEAWVELAYIAAFLENDTHSAHYYYTQAYAINSRNLTLLDNYAHFMMLQRHYASAESLYRQALDISGSEDAYLLTCLGKSLKAQGKEGQAIQRFMQAVIEDPETPEAHYHLAEIFYGKSVDDPFQDAKPAPDEINPDSDYYRALSHVKEVIELSGRNKDLLSKGALLFSHMDNGQSVKLVH